eukprot:scaffold499_cov335-Pavlova_lutheri.AAC.10
MTQRRYVTFLATRPHHFLQCHHPVCTSPMLSIAAINGRRRRACCLSVSNSAIIHGFSNCYFARSIL